MTRKIVILLTLALSSGFSFSQSVEQKKIEFLLNEVENLQGAKFWRNGSSYSAKAAAEHLRSKLKKAGSAVTTAKYFIEKIASKSSTSGKPNQIELPMAKRWTRAFSFIRNLRSGSLKFQLKPSSPAKYHAA